MCRRKREKNAKDDEADIQEDDSRALKNANAERPNLSTERSRGRHDCQSCVLKKPKKETRTRRRQSRREADITSGVGIHDISISMSP